MRLFFGLFGLASMAGGFVPHQSRVSSCITSHQKATALFSAIPRLDNENDPVDLFVDSDDSVEIATESDEPAPSGGAALVSLIISYFYSHRASLLRLTYLVVSAVFRAR